MPAKIAYVLLVVAVPVTRTVADVPNELHVQRLGFHFALAAVQATALVYSCCLWDDAVALRPSPEQDLVNQIAL